MTDSYGPLAGPVYPYGKVFELDLAAFCAKFQFIAWEKK
jgi:hypothetical protein